MIGMNLFIFSSIIELVVIIFLAFLLFSKFHRKELGADAKKGETVLSVLSSSMHAKYCDEWMSLFSEIKYPIDNEDKAKIISLLWNVASISIDCLMVDNNDQNLLQRHRDSTAFLTGETSKWENLKAFHRDPSTVPCQVIAIYDILKEIGYKGVIIAFGYKLVFD